MSNRQIEQNEKMVDFYTEEDRRKDVKDCFKFLKSILERRFEKIGGIKLCDVGCATGDLLWYLASCFNHQKNEFSGIDVDKTLLDIARKRMPFIDFVECDIMNAADFQKKFDVVTCFGVLSLFEDYKKFITKICNLSAGGGTLLYLCSV